MQYNLYTSHLHHKRVNKIQNPFKSIYDVQTEDNTFHLYR